MATRKAKRQCMLCGRCLAPKRTGGTKRRAPKRTAKALFR